MGLFDFPPLTYDNCQTCQAELTGETERICGVCETCFSAGETVIRDVAREWLKCDAALTDLELATARQAARLGELRTENTSLKARCRRLEDAMETRLCAFAAVGVIGFLVGVAVTLGMMGR